MSSQQGNRIGEHAEVGVLVNSAESKGSAHALVRKLRKEHRLTQRHERDCTSRNVLSGRRMEEGDVRNGNHVRAELLNGRNHGVQVRRLHRTAIDQQLARRARKR
ncbi:MAG: hypothetical protein Q4B91_04650 [Atopobiaceae bacterium]|nr:hypothetical protein [Atopobiaceae bacterium]